VVSDKLLIISESMKAPRIKTPAGGPSPELVKIGFITSIHRVICSQIYTGNSIISIEEFL
jgi:hypothetical protein